MSGVEDSGGSRRLPGKAASDFGDYRAEHGLPPGIDVATAQSLYYAAWAAGFAARGPGQ